MKSDVKNRIQELEAKIHILEYENEFLLSKTQENLLLSKAFEDINVYEDINSLFENILEHISILLDIQYSGIFDLDLEFEFHCVSGYAIFENVDNLLMQLNLSAKSLETLLNGENCFVSDSSNDFSIKYFNNSFIPKSLLMVKLNSSWIKNRFFVFLNDNDGPNLSDKIPLFEKIGNIISVKVDRVFYQNELEKINNELEGIVKTRTAELKKQNEEYSALNLDYQKQNLELLTAKEKAEASDMLKSAFLANMSHEIRTPLNSIMGFSRLLSKLDLSNDKRVDYAKILQTSGLRLLNTVNDVLDLSKIDAKQMEVFEKKYYPGRILHEIFSLHSENFRIKGIQFSYTLDSQLENSCIIGDEQKVYQILNNLVNNACKFTGKGYVKFGCLLDDSEIKYYVSDTGIGISADRQEFIFGRFNQENIEMSRGHEGSGLGLAISKGLLELMGGKFQLISEKGLGSNFSFTIPVKKCEPEPIVETSISKSIEASDIQNKTVLIAEDDDLNFLLLKDFFIAFPQIKIIRAINGLEVLEKCSELKNISLILMDIKMPLMDGYETTRILRKTDSKIPIIAVTAIALQGDQEKALSVGCNDYISKPIEYKFFIDKVLKYLKE
jgi:signal transduction histidine kinase/CheY-like chemotaxis protein